MVARKSNTLYESRQPGLQALGDDQRTNLYIVKNMEACLVQRLLRLNVYLRV